jgi:hypothetical protein
MHILAKEEFKGKIKRNFRKKIGFIRNVKKCALEELWLASKPAQACSSMP